MSMSTRENDGGKMTTAEAVRLLRGDPRYGDVVRDSYLDEDVRSAAERFFSSAEFAEVRALVGPGLAGGTVLDLGAGTGIASYALARAGASRVYALEPDPSEVGRAAIARLAAGLPVETLDAFGERIPLAEGAVDIVYARQVLHHTGDLRATLRECARVLRPGGRLLVCREHVADDEEQLRQFLAEHPIHQLAGGEHAYPLAVYVSAIEGAGLRLLKTLGPWDSVINAFPAARTRDELARVPDKVLRERFGFAGRLASLLPGVRSLAWRRVKSYPVPGRHYSFLASKP
jgi:SAM-dependent methyltransferase